MDLSTPERALLAIYDAYRSGDLDAAIACKDFQTEARIALRELGVDTPADSTVLNEMAATLEAAFRAEAATTGLPSLAGVDTEIMGTRQLEPGLVVVAERWHHPDGSLTVGEVYVAETRSGWRVLHPVEETAG